ncbi:MAG: serine/threonine protein kinase [Acidimicrobiales bacterium]
MTGYCAGGLRVGPDHQPDRFLLGEQVAEGAEGRLFRGSMSFSGLTQEVAIKQLLPDRVPVEDWEDRWIAQVEVLRTVQGPGVVPVREGFAGPLPHPPGMASADRTLYLVMNWVDGESLHEWVLHRPHEDPFDTLERLVTVATALDYMHAGTLTNGIPVLHRDIKPSNILVNDAGAVLVDFGLTWALPEGGRIAGLAGTPGYIAPESVKEGMYSPASDRYGFGAVAYFVFVRGEPPHVSDCDALEATLARAPALAGRPQTVHQLMELLDEDPGSRPDCLTEWVTRVCGSTCRRPQPTVVPGPAVPRSPRQRAHQFRTALVALAEGYMALEADGDFRLVRAVVDGGGRVTPAAREAISALGQFWEWTYTAAKGALDDLDAAIRDRRGDHARSLLEPDAIVLPDGTRTGLDALLADLADRLARAMARVREHTAAWNRQESLLAARRASVRHIHQRASVLGAADDPEVAAVLAGMAEVEPAFTLDPWSTLPMVDLDRIIEAADAHVTELERRHETLPDRLTAAAKQVDELADLCCRGADVFDDASVKIKDPVGLLEPLDLAGVEGGGSVGQPALLPWLARIEIMHRSGGWRAADQGLERWQTVADGWLANALAVLRANEAPKKERDDLRGRLTGFRVLAGRAGRAEDATLSNLYRAASETLYVQPCDLTDANRRVQAYIDGVNGT